MSLRVAEPATALEIQKSQDARLWDVLILGPLMLFFAARGKLSAAERVTLGAIGPGTIVYNAQNYDLTRARR